MIESQYKKIKKKNSKDQGNYLIFGFLIGFKCLYVPAKSFPDIYL